jgi:cyanate permease
MGKQLPGQLSNKRLTARIRDSHGCDQECSGVVLSLSKLFKMVKFLAVPLIHVEKRGKIGFLLF